MYIQSVWWLYVQSVWWLYIQSVWWLYVQSVVVAVCAVCGGGCMCSLWWWLYVQPVAVAVCTACGGGCMCSLCGGCMYSLCGGCMYSLCGACMYSLYVDVVVLLARYLHITYYCILHHCVTWQGANYELTDVEIVVSQHVGGV
jgi:hypothetical protein